jgi:hypothetical protein
MGKGAFRPSPVPCNTAVLLGVLPVAFFEQPMTGVLWMGKQTTKSAIEPL